MMNIQTAISNPLLCKFCNHDKEYHRYGYLECSFKDFRIDVEYVVFNADKLVRAVPTRKVIDNNCKCMSFRPFVNICSNKINWYIDRDIPETEKILIW